MATTIDKDLTNALKVARGGKPMQFAFLPKGSEGKLLVGKKIPPKQIAETKSATGASSVFKGRCVGEDGTLVFYVVKEPPGTLLGQLKKRLKDDAGLTFPIEIRIRSDAEAESVEGEAETTEDVAAVNRSPESSRAEWDKALAAVEPAYLRAVRDHPDKANALRAVMGFAQGKAEQEDFPSAIAALRKLAEQLAKTPAGTGGQAAPAAPPVSPPDLTAQWKKNLADWTPGLKAALAAGGPNAPAIGKLLAQATALAKPGGDMAQALAKLTECHTLATSSGREDGKPLVTIWRDAKEAVDGQLGILYAKLKKTGVPVLLEVADEIESVLGKFRVGLMTALTEYDQATIANKATARAKALQVVQAYQANIPQDKHVIAADTNPFKVTVTIRQTLGGALTKLNTLLAAG